MGDAHRSSDFAPCRACSETTLKDNPSAESAQSICEVVKPLAQKIIHDFI